MIHNSYNSLFCFHLYSIAIHSQLLYQTKIIQKDNATSYYKELREILFRYFFK